MNSNQKEIVEGFSRWNPLQMTDGLCGLLRDVLDFNEVEDLAEQIRPQAVELLLGFLRHPKLGTHINVNGDSCGLRVRLGYELDPASPFAEMRLSLDEALMRQFGERWIGLGYTSEVIAIPRADLHPPIPLKWEAGWSVQAIDAWAKSQSTQTELRVEDTYDYARAQQATGTNNWLPRYLGGECQAVWDEMMANDIRSPDRLGEAYAVAKETMRRCRHNLLILEKGLPRLGYRFRKSKRITSPPMLILRQIAKLEKQVGALPLALCAWFEHVGSVDFTGELIPDLDVTSSRPLDPLVVWPSNVALRYDQSQKRGGSILRLIMMRKMARVVDLPIKCRFRTRRRMVSF